MFDCNIVFNNFADISHLKFELIISDFKFYLMKEFGNEDYSDFLEEVNIYKKGSEEVREEYSGQYDKSQKSISMYYIDDYDLMNKMIHHEISHVMFNKNNNLSLSSTIEILGYYFLDEFFAYSNSEGYFVNVIKNNKELLYECINTMNERVNNSYRIIEMIKEHEEDFTNKVYNMKSKVNLKDINDEKLKELEECEDKFLNPMLIKKIYYSARATAYTYILNEVLGKTNEAKNIIYKNIEYIKENINFNNITKENCRVIINNLGVV
ncbi:hypothetical protein PMY12_14735 [Clostridium tertium]|uniref:hypothetical protein n=1 Tax=Clostridium tertium TaxID=1559 RepID=UPI00232EE22A|nr:hypothetical protein [Clostridium tertium]MDB1931694.1 hypothetical protein [Clostridium tertium]MDB1938260.1 hypothetical protein [Clostridium tertium]MDI9216063.1 hypothetical protein [Clostridium tertium]